MRPGGPGYETASLKEQPQGSHIFVGSGLAVLVKCSLFPGSDEFQNWGSSRPLS